MAEEPGADRLNKVLAHAGLGSRRAVEEFILQGRVTVNGQVVRELSTRVDPTTARIEFDGERVRLERFVYYAVNKPKGYVSTNDDPSGRPRVVDLLPDRPERVYSVGRLDESSTGLMLLTNDGEMAHRLTHPRFGVEKVYHALVAGTPDRAVIDRLLEGIWLSDGKARAKRARIIGRRGEATLLEITLAEGKNREVRRMLAKLGHKVMSLTRVAVGPVGLRGLRPGQFRPLTSYEVSDLRKIAAGLSVPTAGALAHSREERRPGGRGTRGGARTAGPPVPTGPAPLPGPLPHQPPGRPSLGGPRAARPPIVGSAAGRPPAGGPRPARPAGPRAGGPQGGRRAEIGPARPAGPRAGGPARPAGPRAGGPGHTRRPPPPPRPAVEPEGLRIVSPGEEAPPQTRRIIGLPAQFRESGPRPRRRPGPAGPRRPRPSGPPRQGGGPRRAGGPPPPAGERRKAPILRRPRRPRPEDGG